jgi:hypothetical protein
MTPSHFCNYIPFEEDLTLYLNNLNFPLPKDDFYHFWLKLAFWFWRRFFFFFRIFSVFLLFCYYLPLVKGVNIHLDNLNSPLPKNDLSQVSSKLAQWFWRRSRKCKSLQMDGRYDGRRDRRTTDNKQSEKLTWAFSLGELKKKCEFHLIILNVLLSVCHLECIILTCLNKRIHILQT